MIEYPTILHAAKAPRKPCIAFEKLDGSNIRIKWTQKKGFCLFGSRTQLFDESHPSLKEAISLFKTKYESVLDWMFRGGVGDFAGEREVICFAEFFGEKTLAGIHVDDDPKDLVLFDILVGHKTPTFVLPQDLIKLSKRYNFEIPDIEYQGNLNDQFINDVKAGRYSVKEGVVCKYTELNDQFMGGVGMVKIKTNDYFEQLKAIYNKDWEKHW